MALRPRMILVHGTRFDARMWDGYADLVPTAEVVTPELPGHGARAGNPWTMVAAVEVIDEEVRVGAERGQPVILVGHSLGGYVATTYAEHNPDALAALVLLGATADPSRHPRLTRSYTGFAALLSQVGSARMARLTNGVIRAIGVRGPLPDASGYDVTPDAWTSVIETARVGQLTELTYPVFLVVGQLDQMRIDLRAYAAANVNAEVRVIRRATHLMPLTHRDAVAAVLRDAVAAAENRVTR